MRELGIPFSYAPAAKAGMISWIPFPLSLGKLGYFVTRKHLCCSFGSDSSAILSNDKFFMAAVQYIFTACQVVVHLLATEWLAMSKNIFHYEQWVYFKINADMNTRVNATSTWYA